MSHIRPLHGPTIFFVLASNLLTWLNELLALVDFGKLGIKLVVAHSSVTDPDVQLTHRERDALKTVKDPTDLEAQFSPQSAADKPKQRGFPSADSSLFWILTTWNT